MIWLRAMSGDSSSNLEAIREGFAACRVNWRVSFSSKISRQQIVAYVSILISGGSHKHRNLLGHAPQHLHDELTTDYRDMSYAGTAAKIETHRKAFLRKWRLKCRAVAASLEEASERLFTFTRRDPSQWKSAKATNAMERLDEEFQRQIKTRTVQPCAEIVSMLVRAC